MTLFCMSQGMHVGFIGDSTCWDMTPCPWANSSQHCKRTYSVHLWGSRNPRQMPGHEWKKMYCDQLAGRVGRKIRWEFAGQWREVQAGHTGRCGGIWQLTLHHKRVMTSSTVEMLHTNWSQQGSQRSRWRDQDVEDGRQEHVELSLQPYSAYRRQWL
jgi:hypothetical protein